MYFKFFYLLIAITAIVAMKFGLGWLADLLIIIGIVSGIVYALKLLAKNKK